MSAPRRARRDWGRYDVARRKRRCSTSCGSAIYGFRFKFGVRAPASAQDAPPNRSHALTCGSRRRRRPPAESTNSLGSSEFASMTAPRRASRFRWRSATTVGSNTACSRSREFPPSTSRRRTISSSTDGSPCPATAPPSSSTATSITWDSSPPPTRSPSLDERGVAQVPVDYYRQDDIAWLSDLPVNTWVAMSFDRFWPPERESVEYIAQIGNCDPPHD